MKASKQLRNYSDPSQDPVFSEVYIIFFSSVCLNTKYLGRLQHELMKYFIIYLLKLYIIILIHYCEFLKVNCLFMSFSCDASALLMSFQFNYIIYIFYMFFYSQLQVVELDLSSVVTSVSGPKRPHDRVSVSDMKKDFNECLVNKVCYINLFTHSFIFNEECNYKTLITFF